MKFGQRTEYVRRMPGCAAVVVMGRHYFRRRLAVVIDTNQSQTQGEQELDELGSRMKREANHGRFGIR